MTIFSFQCSFLISLSIEITSSCKNLPEFLCFFPKALIDSLSHCLVMS